MVRFGRVEGVVAVIDEPGAPRLRLVVHLETADGTVVVRDEIVHPVRPIATPEDLVWHADQWTQETIGTDLAAAGWEALGAGEIPVPEPGELPRSAPYAVRRL
jgi:hypothetical protein